MAGDSAAFEFFIKKLRDPDSAEKTQIGQIRSLTKGIEGGIVVDMLLPELKAHLPPNAFTDQELEEIIRGSIRQQRLLTPFGLRVPDSRLEDIFERSLSIASREVDRRKLAGPGPSPFSPPRRVTPRRRGDSVYKPRRPFVGGAMKDGPLTSRRQSPHVRFREAIPAPRPSLIQPPSVRRSAPKPSPRSSPIQPPAARGSISKPAPGSPRKLSPPDRRRENRQQRNGFGLRVQFRVNFAPVKTASRPGGTSDEAPPPRPRVQVTGASRGGGGGGGSRAGRINAWLNPLRRTCIFTFCSDIRS